MALWCMSHLSKKIQKIIIYYDQGWFSFKVQCCLTLAFLISVILNDKILRKGKHSRFEYIYEKSPWRNPIQELGDKGKPSQSNKSAEKPTAHIFLNGEMFFIF